MEPAMKRLLLVLTLAAGVPFVACQPKPDTSADAKKKDGKKKDTKKDDDEDGEYDAAERPKPPPPLPIDDERMLRQLQADNEGLKRELAEGKSDRITGVINAHEHLYKLKDLEKYLPAARRAGVVTTVVVSSPIFTLEGKGEKGEPGMSKNFEDVVLEASKQYPGEIIPFCTIDPRDPGKLDRLKKHVQMGCKGLKMYSGHTNFYDGPLDATDMDPVFSYVEEIGLPVLWHVYMSKYWDEITHVINKHPKMNLLIPHYGVVFWKPKDGTLQKLEQLMREHKNLYIDTSLGTRQILTDGMAAIEPAIPDFQQFFSEFQDQIVWGTDSVITGNNEKTPAWFEKVIWATRDHLEKDVLTTDLAAAYSKYYQKGRDGDGRYQGLHLPAPILKKIYVDNAKRWLHLK